MSDISDRGVNVLTGGVMCSKHGPSVQHTGPTIMALSTPSAGPYGLEGSVERGPRVPSPEEQKRSQASARSERSCFSESSIWQETALPCWSQKAESCAINAASFRVLRGSGPPRVF